MATATAEIRKKLDVKSPDQLVEYLNILIYGDPGTGKTWLAGTAEDSTDTKPVLFLDVEGGTTTIRKRKGIDVVSIRSITDIEKTYNTLFMDTSDYYKTVVIDSLTELQSLDMNDIMRGVHDKRPDQEIPSQREWGMSRDHMRKIVRAFRDLPVNTIMTALVVYERDESNVQLIAPAFPGKLRSEIPGFVDVVGYLSTATEKDELVRRLQFAKTRRVVAKDRTSSLGDIIENPTIPELWKLMKEGG